MYGMLFLFSVVFVRYPHNIVILALFVLCFLILISRLFVKHFSYHLYCFLWTTNCSYCHCLYGCCCILPLYLRSQNQQRFHLLSTSRIIVLFDSTTLRFHLDMDPFWNSHLLCYWGSHHIFGFISRHVSFRFIWSWILKWFWEERIEPNLEWMNTFMLRLCCWNEADVSSVGIWTLLIFSCTSCSFSQLRIIVDETFNCLLNPLSLKMPPKGDVVTENEIQLSSMIGDIQIISKQDELTTYENQPARSYHVCLFLLMNHK